MRFPHSLTRRWPVSSAGLALSLCLFTAPVGAQVVTSGTGANIAAITPTRDAFRTALGGGTVAGANGSFGGLRREINWDGVPDAQSSPNSFTANFFNSTSPRGVVFSTPGTGFQVSANTGIAAVEFDNINAGYSTSFAAFSAQRLFTPIGSNITDVTFFLPGTPTAAVVSGFGAMFTDVDLANTTSLQFFDRNNNALGTPFFAPALVGSETFSFLGVQFASPVVGRVRITTGNAALAAGVNDSNGSPTDLVVMDDFIYAEPTAAPEPAAAGLVLLGLLAMVGPIRAARRH